MLQHYIFIQYKTGTPATHIELFRHKMLALKNSIKEIQQLEVGIDEIHDERSWDLILIMQFQSIEALRHYQQHPDHVAVMQFNGPHVANVGSLDFHKE